MRWLYFEEGDEVNVSIPPRTEGEDRERRERAASLPASARRSADHGRALRAADASDLRLAKKLVQRPLMSVWEAIQSDEKHVALVVVDACATDPERERILRAANALARLGKKDGVQSCTAVRGDTESFLSDYCVNGTSSDLLVLRWPLRERLIFMARVCEAVQTLHAANLVHGGLCPENVLLDDELSPVVWESGMVSLADSLEGDREGFFGYGAYAAPEVQDGTNIDVRSDVFSVGRLLAFVVTEREPDDASEGELAERAKPLGAVYARATAFAPERRHASVAELRADLDRVRNELMATVPPPAARMTLPNAPRYSTVTPPRPPTMAPPRSPTVAPPRAATDRPPRHAEASHRERAAAEDEDGESPSSYKIALPGIVVALVSLAAAYALPVGETLAFGLVLVVGGGAAAATFAVPMSGVRWRAFALLGALAAAVAGQPVARAATAGAYGRLHRASPASREAVVALLRDGDRDFTNANLAAADLSQLDLGWASLSGADLSNTDLSRALLVNAHLDQTNLTGAILNRADLSNADLSTARGATAARCDLSTMLPSGWECAGGKPAKAAPVIADPAILPDDR